MKEEVELHIYDSGAKLVGNFPMGLVRIGTSYPVQGAQFSKAYKRGVWDGRKHLFNKKTGAFPLGLIKTVQGILESAGHPVLVEDHRIPPSIKEDGYDLEGVEFVYPYDYQQEACEAAVEAKQGILKLATNAGKTECACAITKHLGVKTMFVVSTKELLYQAKARYEKRLGLNEGDVGLIGDGHFAPGKWITIATVGTLKSRINKPECQEFLASVELLFLDECHHAGSEIWYTVSVLCPAYYRYGLSGTPLDRTDGANLRLIAATGEIIYEVTNKFLVDRGISAKAEIIWDKVTTPVLKKRIAYPTAYKQGVVENPDLVKKIVEWTLIFHEMKLSTLILVEEISQGRILDDSIWNNDAGVFVPHEFINGEEDTGTRQRALDDFANRNLPVLIASTILDEGVDVPTIDTLILAGSRKSRIRTMQRLGRGLRGQKLIVVEFSNFTNKYLLKHSLERYEDYKKEDCFPLHQSGPDAALIERIWNAEDSDTE